MNDYDVKVAALVLAADMRRADIAGEPDTAEKHQHTRTLQRRNRQIPRRIEDAQDDMRTLVRLLRAG